MLTSDQIARYHENGYVVADFRLGHATLEAISSRHSRLVERYPCFADYCPTLLAIDQGFIQFARDSAILDMVGQLIGDDIALWNMSFFAKPAWVGSKTPWHQDGQYWPIRPLATCTVWIAIDDSTPQNGCLQVIPGSHKDKRLRNHRINNGSGLALNQELSCAEFDPAGATNIELKAGQISLHDVYLVHGSQPNRSARARRGMTLRFMPTSAQYDREIEKQQFAASPPPQDSPLRLVKRRPLYLMRGVDRYGAHDFDDSTIA